MSLISRCLLLIVFFILSGCVKNKTDVASSSSNPLNQKPTLIAEGQAPIINQARLQARRIAIQSAIQSMASQLSHQINQSILISNAKVVDEWQHEDNYHVQVVSTLSAAPYCQAAYKKRIVATAFPTVESGQISAHESQDLYSGIPREIIHHLMESGGFIGRNNTGVTLYANPAMAPEIQPAEGYLGSSVINIAQQMNSQFVLSGVIRDIAVESGEYVRGAGILSQIRSSVRDISARRGVTLDVYVHDGFSGALLFQHRYSDSVLGDVWIPAGYAVGSERFNATPAGHIIDTMIKLISQDINRVFGCYPFTARVLKKEHNRLVISAGAQDKLKPGDNLVVYATDHLTDDLGFEGSQKQAIGMLKIDQVSAGYASGIMEIPADIRQVKVGDWVKSW